MKKGKTKDVMCRPMYCKYCDAADRPKTGDIVVLYGRTHRQLKAKKVEDVKHYGFTPHLIEVLDRTPTHVTLRICCGADGCGVYIHWDDNEFELDIIEVNEIEMKIADYEALKNFKDEDFMV